MKRRLLMPIVSLLAVTALLVLAPIALAQQNEGLSESDVAERVATLQGATPLYHETFREDTGLWELDSTDEYALRYSAGAYRVDILGENIYAWGISQEEVEDFYVEVDAFYVGGPENNEYGIVFRQVDNENFYAFSVSGDGFYALRKLSEGEWIDIIEWTESEAINTGIGSVNRLGVFAQGPLLTLLVNDQPVEQVEDDEFVTGLIGLGAGSFDDPNVEIAYDDLKLWDLQAEVAPLPTAEVTPEPISIDVSARLADVRANSPDVSDEFRRDSGAWTLDSDENVTYRIAGREFTIQVNQPNWIGWSVNDEVAAGDLLVEVDATLANGPKDSEFGILFRYQDNRNFYFFAIDIGTGSFSLWKEVDGEWSELTPWSTSDAIDVADGAINRLAVLAEGSQITALINDEAVLQVVDNSFASGAVALAVGAFSDPGPAVVFDNLDVWVLSTALPPLETPEPLDTPEPAPPVSVENRLNEIHSDPATMTSEFRRDDGTWSMDVDEGVTHFYARRALHIRIDRENWVSWSLHADLSPANFLAEIDAAHVEGPLDGEYGLVFRFVDDDNFYFYAINANGFYSLWKQVGGGWETIINWTQSAALNSGEGALNRLGVLAEGDQITLIANDVGLQEVTDGSHSEGEIGVAAGVVSEPGVEIAFDNFALWDLDQ